MSKPTCATCRFFTVSVDKQTGDCQRYPPAVGVGARMWPPVAVYNWYGEWAMIPCDHEYPANWLLDIDYVVPCRKCGQLI